MQLGAHLFTFNMKHHHKSQLLVTIFMKNAVFIQFRACHNAICSSAAVCMLCCADQRQHEQK